MVKSFEFCSMYFPDLCTLMRNLCTQILNKLCAEKQKAMYINLMTTVANETVSGQLLHIFHFSFPVTFTQ